MIEPVIGAVMNKEPLVYPMDIVNEVKVPALQTLKYGLSNTHEVLPTLNGPVPALHRTL